MAITNDQQIQDPSIQGTGGLKGLDGINRLKAKGINIDTDIFNLAEDYRGTMQAINESATPKQSIGYVGVNDSSYDEDITSASQLDNLSNTRGEFQPWYAQIGAGLTKGVILAGTTFLDGTIGLLTGIGYAFGEGRISALWDNPFSQAMQNFNEWSEEALPNYYTDAERNEPWYENIFTANFIGDKFIKNLGFTVGAFYSGNVGAGILKATKLPQLIGAITKSTRAPSMVVSTVGAFTSALNEGRIEAIINSKDWFELQKAQLDDQYAKRLKNLDSMDLDINLYNETAAKEQADYEAALDKLSEDRLKMGNMDLLMNLPILTASNLVQFGKMYANGFKTARRSTNIVGRAGNYTSGTTTGSGVRKGIINAAVEGTEEISQRGASVISGIYYENDVNNFYRAKIDPEAEQETLSWMKAAAQGINETVNDAAAWEEFTIGALTGALGMPIFRRIHSESGSLQSPITLRGGLVGEIKEAREKMKRETEIVDYLNKRVQSPEFLNYYQSLTRHNKYQNDMNKAVENNDEFEFKNAEHAQLISDIAMFDNAGKIEDLVTLVNAAYDISQENLTSIVENTTSTITDENGKEHKVGPFVDENGNPMYSTPEGKQQMIDKLTQSKNEILDAIKSYAEIRNSIDINTQEKLSDEQLEELTWLKSQIKNWKSRYKTLGNELKPTLISIENHLRELHNKYKTAMEEEGSSHVKPTEKYTQYKKTVENIAKTLDFINYLRSNQVLNPAVLLGLDEDATKFLKSLIEQPAISGLTADEAQIVNKKIDDIGRIVQASTKYNEKLQEYLHNTNKLQEEIASIAEETAKEETKKKQNSLKDKLTSANSLSEFKQALNEEKDPSIKEEVLKDLENESNEMAKNYKETSQYEDEVRKAIDELPYVEPEDKERALKLFQDQIENSSTLEELANPNSIYINNEDAFYEDPYKEDNPDADMELLQALRKQIALEDLQKAQYALQSAMSRVNNDNKFKDRFSKEYKKPVEIVRQVVEKDGFTKIKYGKRKGDTIINNTGLKINREDIPRSELESIEELLNALVNPTFELLELRFTRDGKYAGTVRVAGTLSGAPVVHNFEFTFDKNPDEFIGDDRLTTGDSATTTVPPVNGKNPIETTQAGQNEVKPKKRSISESFKEVGLEEGDFAAPIELNTDSGVQNLTHSIAELIRKKVERVLKKPNPTKQELHDAIVSKDLKTSVPMNTLDFLYKALDKLKEGKMTVEEVMGLVEYHLGVDDDTHKKFLETYKSTSKNDNEDKTTEDIIATQESPVGDITQNEVRDEIRDANNNAETPQSLDNKQHGKRPYYRPSIPELHIQASKEGDFRPFNVVVTEREKGVNFDAIYNYLRDNGAFNYINEGNLKIGDVLGFMIDPEFNDHTIFIVDKKNNQVVGSLDESSYSVNRYEGLATLEQKIREEFNNNTDKNKRFIATPTTKVSQIMIGRIPYSSEERSLASTPNVSREGKAPIFGIIKNGTLSTGGKIDDGLIIKPVDMAQKEGRMYLLIPNAAGKYSPAAVRVKHFNITEFNPNNVEIQSTQMYKNIQESIDKLANSLNEEDLNNAVKSLASNLYIRDLHIDWFTSNEGNGIRFTKVQRDAQGNEIYEEKNGEKRRKEIVKTVFLTEKQVPNTGDNKTQTEPALKNIEDIAKEISNILLDFNLPIQVNIGMLNRGGYNNMLINSNVLTSNISDARVLGSWFTTDYFDVEGNLHRATSPASITPVVTGKVDSPVGGTEGAITGVKMGINGVIYWADLTNNVIRDSNNQVVHFKDEQLMLDLVWIDKNFGDATNGSLIWNNKALLPDGRVLDRNTRKYLTGKEAQEVKDKIAGRERTIKDSEKIIAQIAENQKKVDKTRTDNEFYYILEDDGQYHEYDRVHKRLGGNWVISQKQKEAIKNINNKLFELQENIPEFNNYLDQLSNHWKVDLSAFKGKTDSYSRSDIIAIIRDKISGTNSLRALNAGTAVDSVIRNFFTSNEAPIRPDNMSEEAFKDLINSLTEIKSNIEARGERFITNNVVLFQKYTDGTRVAGEVDILAVDKDGNFKIYDVKTSRYSFYDFVDRYGNKVNYFIKPSATQRMSTKDYYTLQLSAYKNLFESQYHTPITTLAVLPFVLSYSGDTVSKIAKEKGILITYNPAVNVPLETPATLVQTDTTSPIFNASLETQNPIEDLTPEHSMNTTNEKVGYFELDGKLHKGYVTPIAVIDDIEINITKVPNITKGFGRANEEAHVASNSFYAVFPNGKTFLFVKNNPVEGGMTQSQVEEAVSEKLKGNPTRVKELASEKTILFDPDAVPAIVSAPVQAETSATILSTSAELGAAKTVQAEQAVDNIDDEFEDDLDLGKLRKTIDESESVWNQEKELTWLRKVLPQLSDNDRVKVVKGLIKVGNRGTLAWGQFNNGIITLSDVAAKGTAYHEAFHAVFNLLLDYSERQALYKEAKELYGEKDDLSLEEDMAEGFREYVMTRQDTGLLSKIKNFFKDLWIKVSNWNRVRPSLTAYYQMINNGKYSDTEMPIESLSQVKSATENTGTYSRTHDDIRYRKVSNSSFESLNQEVQETLLDKGWTAERFNLVSQEERDQAVKCMAL